MTSFEEVGATHKHRMAHLRETFNRQRYLFARSQRDPGYTILLKPAMSADAAFEVQSFRDGQPIRHRDYDRLDGGSPAQNALQEFAGQDIRLERRVCPAKGIEWEQYAAREYIRR